MGEPRESTAPGALSLLSAIRRVFLGPGPEPREPRCIDLRRYELPAGWDPRQPPPPTATPEQLEALGWHRIGG